MVLDIGFVVAWLSAVALIVLKFDEVYREAKRKNDAVIRAKRQFDMIGKTVPRHLIPDSVMDNEYTEYVRDERGF